MRIDLHTHSSVSDGTDIPEDLVRNAAAAGLDGIEIRDRSVVADGRAFGTAGPYERIHGRMTFRVDPDLPRNAIVRDLQFAARDADGRVEFAADFYLLKPVAAERGNGMLLLDVVNRGRKLMLVFEHRMVDLVADRVGSRFKQLARLVGRIGSIVRN